MNQPHSSNAMVYFIRVGDFVKIGFSSMPKKRLAQIDALSPIQPEIIAVFNGAKALENKLHYYFRHLHVRREWFFWCEEMQTIPLNGLPDLSDLPSATEIRKTTKTLGTTRPRNWWRETRPPSSPTELQERNDQAG